MFLKKTIIMVSLIVCGLISGACSPAQINPEKSNGYKVVDESGYVFFLAQKPTRIASLTYGTDEILFGLLPAERLISLSRWADDREITFLNSTQSQAVKSRFNESSEQILALQPDLVIASTVTNPDLVKTLRIAGLKVYLAKSPNNLTEMYAKILGIAKAVGEEENGEKIILDMKLRLEILNKKLSEITLADRKTGMAMSYVGAIGRSGSLLDDIFRHAHLRNAAAEQGLSKGSALLAKEQIIKANPNMFFLPTWSNEPNSIPEKYREEFLADPAFKNLKAIKEEKIFMFSDRYRYVASQYIVNSIEKLAELAYPELF